MLTIHVKNLTYMGCHGCTSREKEADRQRPFHVDVEMETDFLPALWTDRPEDTVDWTPVRGIVEAIISGPPRHTVEILAAFIAVHVFYLDSRLTAVTVTVTKPCEWDVGPGLPGVTLRVTRDELKGIAVKI